LKELDQVDRCLDDAGNLEFLVPAAAPAAMARTGIGENGAITATAAATFFSISVPPIQFQLRGNADSSVAA
jgi:hypothetical protein